MLMEDFREGMLLPESGALRKKGLAMVVPGSDACCRNNDDALVRRHLFLANLMCSSNIVWQELGMGAGANYVIEKSSIACCPAIFTSAAVRQAIRIPFASQEACNDFFGMLLRVVLKHGWVVAARSRLLRRRIANAPDQ